LRPHSIFLRKDCVLPEPLDPLTEPVGENWMRVEELAAAVFDTMIRQKGWHFMQVDRPCKRRGLGLTEKNAAKRSLDRALNAVGRRFNAAELIDTQITKYPGFYVASVTVQPRQIQQYTWLEIAGDWHQLAVPVR